jgi:Domain of unknown function (DUF4926)
MENTFKILDVVALLIAVPKKNLPKGQVGTIVEIWGKAMYEVEFCDLSGQTLALVQLAEKDLLLLHYHLKAA